MHIRWLIFTALTLGLLLPARAENTEQLAPASQTNILSLLPASLQNPELRVLDAVVAADDVYLLLGDPVGRPGLPSAILRLRGDGVPSIASLPEGQPRDLSVDANANVHVLVIPQSRTAEPAIIRCDPSLSACAATPLAKDGRQIWSRRSVAGHVAELSLDGALYLDGAPLLAPASGPGRIVPNRLLAAPGGSRVMRLNQATGTLTVIDPLWPSERLDVVIQGAGFQAALEANHAAAARLLPNASSIAMTIYAAAPAEDGGLFLALSPYNRYAGATILQTTADGRTQRTIRCALPNDPSGEPTATPAYIGVSGNRLYLVSPMGDLLTYRL